MDFDSIKIELQRNKIGYYIKGYIRKLIPSSVCQKLLPLKLAGFKNHPEAYIMSRVNFYNKLNSGTSVGHEAIPISEYKNIPGNSVYRHDFYEHGRFFRQDLKANFLFGDIRHVGNFPSLQKSRPIVKENDNAVILKLEKKRHFLFIHDSKPFRKKKNILFGRSAVMQSHRIAFMEKYFNHPLCDLGQINTEGGKPEWIKPWVAIGPHLDHKFILALEGYDVASNLKWIMSSNSVAVMTRPKFETWFMESTLIPNHHYIEIKDDYSDLEEVLNHYIRHPEEAETIIRNAHQYIRPFLNKKQEDLISLLVLQKYFQCTGQL
jgi:hypothetical protein